MLVYFGTSTGSNVRVFVSVGLLLLLLLPLLLGLSLHLSASTEQPYVILLEAKGEGKVEFKFSGRVDLFFHGYAVNTLNTHWTYKTTLRRVFTIMGRMFQTEKLK